MVEVSFTHICVFSELLLRILIPFNIAFSDYVSSSGWYTFTEIVSNSFQISACMLWISLRAGVQFRLTLHIPNMWIYVELNIMFTVHFKCD